MGALQKTINLFDLVIPEKAIKFEGMPHPFYKGKFAECDRGLLEMTKRILEGKKFVNYHVGKTISVDSLFTETKQRVKERSNKGFLGVDMETATTYSIAKTFGAKAIAILRIVDSLVKEGELISDLRRNKKWKAENKKLKKIVKNVVSEIIESSEK